MSFDKSSVLLSRVYPKGSQPARLYGLPKLHKSFDTNFTPNIPKFRPINSSINSYNYNLAKFLSELVSPYIPNTYSCKDTFSFINELKKCENKNYFMVSFDVTSLYTNIPLNEAIQLAVDKILDNHPNISISKEELTELFHFATSKTHFLFNGQIYDQIDGIAMGSPLAPALANIFMGHHEENWLKSELGKRVKFYKRYVDDIFCLIENESFADQFLAFLNNQHQNIKFTLEKQTNNTLPFLDIKIEDKGNNFETSIFKKKSNTGLLTNFTSFIHFRYKKCLVKTLIDRIFKINSSWEVFHKNIAEMTETLQKNNFPDKFIFQNIREELSKKIENKPFENQKNEKNVHYFKLPYIGTFSKITEQKINYIIKKYCKTSTVIKLAFTSTKISSFFSPKDKVSKDYLFNVVYKFTCNGCQSVYVNFTTCHTVGRR